MATHLYISPRPKPRWWDIILAHAIELAIAAYCAVMGTFVVVNARNYTADSGGTLGELPLYLIYAIGLFVGAGGITAIIGLVVRRQNLRIELNIEQIGWILLSVGWLAYIYAAVRYADSATSALIAGGCISLGGALRAVALILLERNLDRVVREDGDATPEEGNSARP